jgi:KUP system potassium uptake protein
MSRLVRALPIRRCPLIIAHVRIASRPWVPPVNRLVVTRLDDAAWRVEIRFGYLEPTNVPKALSGVFEIAPELPRAITYVIGSEGIIAPPTLRRPRDIMFNIFAVLSHNATRSVDWYELPSDRTLEIRHSIRL